MTPGKKKKPPAAGRPRNPFAGQKQSGAGYHSETRYGKKERRRQQRELEEETETAGKDEQHRP